MTNLTNEQKQQIVSGLQQLSWLTSENVEEFVEKYMSSHFSFVYYEWVKKVLRSAVEE